MQKVVLATGNAGKVRELASLLSDFGLDIVAQTDLGVDSAEETGLTFIENAILKARHAAKVTGLPAIADDSGLAVDVLGGAPGIYSARYSGEDATDQKNLQKLLETLKDVPDDQRQARFHCVLVYLRHAEDPTPLVCHGSWPGVITREPAGTGGFGVFASFQEVFPQTLFRPKITGAIHGAGYWHRSRYDQFGCFLL